jgi:hypothetical protein
VTQVAGDPLHRIGGGSIDNLRLKPAEERLKPPGISVLRFPAPGDAAAAIRAAFPKATGLQALARTVGTITDEAIRAAGFDVLPGASNRLPTHHRLIHPDGVGGFTDANLARLASAFVNTIGH